MAFLSYVQAFILKQKQKYLSLIHHDLILISLTIFGMGLNSIFFSDPEPNKKRDCTRQSLFVEQSSLKV